MVEMIRTHSAIVLRPTPFEEGGLVVSFLTEHGERLVGLARGAKKPTAKWVSSFEPLGLVKVGFFGREQAEIKRVTRCELQHSPMTLGHLESSLVVACLADVFDRVAREGVEDDRLFRLLSACARCLKEDPSRSLAVLAYAEHWMLHLMGLLPHPRLCGRCGGGEAPLVLFTQDHGWCCAACTPVDPREALPPGTREHLKLLRTLPAAQAPDPGGSEAARAVTRILRDRLRRELGGLKSYEVLEKLVVPC
ncbi:DNA repair protein RecO [Mesoterricola silvestris]|uniref:DNA repair protein RecO n=1 Tax=Mesoterricola silvestris TaxID=2927979 RepID=A0AA48K8V8_9BACT|nr:DNA repair protein RecO [Mesoterricola silvestris]BDU72515.1 DNA repair protein RecO [Mesoterricola silvestris]